MNYVEVVLPRQAVLALFFGGVVLVPLVAGVIATYREHGLAVGIVLGAGFCSGATWLFWDPTVGWLENVSMMIVLGGVAGSVLACLGALVGYGLRRVRSPATSSA